MIETARRTLWGRRHGKTLRASQKAYLAEDLGPLAVPGIGGGTLIDPRAVFGDARPLWLEIGFGAGEHLVHQAALHPEVGLIGAEPFVNGVAMLLGRIRAAGVANLRVHPGDARDVLDVLPAGTLARVFLLYPDPWPKRRHGDRRFLSAAHLGPLARAMAPGAELRLATDVAGYAAEALRRVPAHGFELSAGDASVPWPDWTQTRFEAKALEAGRKPAYYTFQRGPC